MTVENDKYEPIESVKKNKGNDRRPHKMKQTT